MIRFVLARLLQSLIALAILSVVVFVLARATGDPLQMILPMNASAEDYANARAYLGLDRSYVQQYLSFAGRAVVGDLGTSLRARRPVSELIAERLPNSARLALFAMGVSIAMAFPLGVMAAVRKGTAPMKVWPLTPWKSSKGCQCESRPDGRPGPSSSPSPRTGG